MSRTVQLQQPSLGLTTIDVWRDRFIAAFNAAPHSHPFDLLPKRYSNASAKVLAPDAGEFDFDRFKAFGEFLRWHQHKRGLSDD